jgi:hypothetical protein
MKKIVRIFGIGALLILIFSLSSCYYNEVIEENLPPIEDVSYAFDIQPIWNQSCIACHPTLEPPDLTEGNSYNALMSMPGSIVPGDAEGSELLEMLKGGGDNPMPPGGSIGQANINLIESWINQGALDN